MRDIHGILRNEKVKGNLQSNRYNINQFSKNHYTHIYLPPKNVWKEIHQRVLSQEIGAGKKLSLYISTFPYNLNKEKNKHI